MNYRNDLYASCIEWELNKLTLQLCSAFKTNSQVPEKNKLKNLLPVRSVYGAYDINQKLDFKNPITNEYYEEILNPSDVDMSNEKREGVLSETNDLLIFMIRYGCFPISNMTQKFIQSR